MCTIMTQRETLPAEKRSRIDSQKAVDKLMAYDKLLSEQFTRSELQKLFGKDSWEYKPEAYSALTDAEKKIVDELGLAPQSTPAEQDETSKTTTAVGYIPGFLQYAGEHCYRLPMLSASVRPVQNIRDRGIS